MENISKINLDGEEYSVGVDKAGDTMTGNLSIDGSGVNGKVGVISGKGKVQLFSGIGDDGNTAGLYRYGPNGNKWMIYSDEDGTYFRCNEIPVNTDLNDIIKVGFYRCARNVDVATLVNSPTSLAFTLIVYAHAGTHQEIIEYTKTNPKIYMRNADETGTWSSWYRVYTTADPPTMNNLLIELPYDDAAAISDGQHWISSISSSSYIRRKISVIWDYVYAKIKANVKPENIGASASNPSSWFNQYKTKNIYSLRCYLNGLATTIYNPIMYIYRTGEKTGHIRILINSIAYNSNNVVLPDSAEYIRCEFTNWWPSGSSFIIDSYNIKIHSSFYELIREAGTGTITSKIIFVFNGGGYADDSTISCPLNYWFPYTAPSTSHYNGLGNTVIDIPIAYENWSSV